MSTKSKQGAPQTTTTSSKSSFPDELKPYITDILGRSKDRAEQKYAEGYQQYAGPRIADFGADTLEAQQAMRDQFSQGIASNELGQSSSYYAPAYSLTASGADEFDSAAAQRYMSPYMQNVVDIQKREASRDADMARQGTDTGAVGAGSFGGSRHAFIESQANKDLAERKGDIQIKGLQSSYDQAGAQFAADQARKLQAGAQFGTLGQAASAQASKEIAGLGEVGRQEEAQSQRGLDLAYQEFLKEQQHPEQVLQEYSSIVRGFPLAANTTGIQVAPGPQSPSTFNQVTGLAAQGLGTYMGAGGTFGAPGNKGGGLADIAKRAYGGGINPDTATSTGGLAAAIPTAPSVATPEMGAIALPAAYKTDPFWKDSIKKLLQQGVDMQEAVALATEATKLYREKEREKQTPMTAFGTGLAEFGRNLVNATDDNGGWAGAASAGVAAGGDEYSSYSTPEEIAYEDSQDDLKAKLSQYDIASGQAPLPSVAHGLS